MVPIEIVSNLAAFNECLAALWRDRRGTRPEFDKGALSAYKCVESTTAQELGGEWVGTEDVCSRLGVEKGAERVVQSLID